MRFSRRVTTLLVFLFAISLSQGAFAQKYEIYPYAGGFWPMKIDEFKLMNQGIWGVKGGYFFSDQFELEGSFGYLNHFKFDNVNVGDFVNLNNITVITITNNNGNNNNSSVVVKQLDPNRVTIIESDPKQRAYLWEANASYNFFRSNLGQSLVPYLTAGVGVTTVTSSDDFPTTIVAIDQPNLSAAELNQINQHVDQRIAETRGSLPTPINTGSYLTFNYGVGLKGYRLWGPVGFRMDFLGRNLPNFASKALNAFQATGGITFAWGER